MNSLENVSMIGLKGIWEKLGKGEVILDVRGRDEFSEGHVPGAINIPHDEVSKRADQLRGYGKIYIHCRSGKRSQLAFADLDKQGLKNLVCISDGGMLDWEAAGFPVKKGT